MISVSTIKEYTYPSKTGLSDIYARCWAPDNDSDVKAIFQICHGMAEHLERYSDFAAYLNTLGYAVYINDHIGHGKSVKSDDSLGYFGEKNGWISFVEDARTLTQTAKKEYPNKPIIMFGHSMGSFVNREYAKRYGTDDEIKAFIFCGTSGKNPGAPAGIIMAKAFAKIKGSKYRSSFINSIAFGSYNKRINPNRTDFDWLTRDNEIVDKYVADKYCGFLFTAAGFEDMFTLLDSVSGKDWYAALNKSKPYLLVSGQEDPVGSYGKGIEQVYTDMKSAGISDTTIKLFAGARHEILNETNNKEVYEFIGSWADSKIK